ncbi:DUF2325 domain-containing protein [Bacillus benzoevorans]|uniref:Dihydroorotate dehydrogenase n=1 Tax=Bacillus benzoevorans TaxID=1456 RepID=A0A7X0HNX6_9BACI|nr:DUF2325 domain-containing protein [Bacillus benzoevorans]MBB6444229.1 hypothetical protein [Bacillus benzoevorans]
MNSLLIIGADHLGVIPDKLASVGFRKILHMNGRKVQMVKRDIPESINCILILTDYVNHNLTAVIKKRAKNQSIPIYYAKRSWSSIYHVLKDVV